MAITRFQAWAYELDGFRVLFITVANDLTATAGITYMTHGQFIHYDAVPGQEALAFSNKLRNSGYVRHEVQL